MRLKSVIETPEGNVQFEGELSNEQVQFLLEVGLNVVLANGATPFATENEIAPQDIHVGTETAH